MVECNMFQLNKKSSSGKLATQEIITSLYEYNVIISFGSNSPDNVFLLRINTLH